MDLNTVTEFIVPSADAPSAGWQEGDAWLAGGTLLFYAPWPNLRRLRDLSQMGWRSITVTDGGLELAATCGITELHEFVPPPEWASGPLLRQSVEEYLASFKVWNRQTVGGNICASLPAGPMITMTVALEATYLLWAADGSRRTVPAIDFVTGNLANVLRPGELLRSVHVPAASLARRYALRRFTLTKHGRSSVFLVGTHDASTGELLITVTAATSHPFHVRFASPPTAVELTAGLDAAIPMEKYFDDPNGTPDHRRHLTYLFAEQLRTELAPT